MGNRTSYTPGTFCYVELSTSDAEKAADFYSEILGWEIDTVDFDGGMLYRTGQVGGQVAAGIVPTQPGWQPAWFTYIAVESAEETAKKAEQLGATILMPVTEIPDLGRFAVLQDPQGAVFGPWEADGSIGSGIVNDPGCFTLAQLNANDVSEAQKFYGDLFGWNFVEQKAPEGDSYWGINVGDKLNAGMMKNPTDGPAHWLVYFTAPASLEVMLKTIESAGGAVVIPPTPIPDARFMVASDPQGITFALFEGLTDD